jgi:purine-binding chemotaxis protein CheW
MEETLLNDEITSEEEWKYLIFSVNDVDYGVEIGYVTEIIGIQPITAVPHTPSYIRGIINIRGTIVPVVDMRMRFNLEPAEYDERTCIISLCKENIHLGLIVDSVVDVVQLSAETVLPPPADNSDAKNKFLKAVGKYANTVKQLIDINKIYETEDCT